MAFSCLCDCCCCCCSSDNGGEEEGGVGSLRGAPEDELPGIAWCGQRCCGGREGAGDGDGDSGDWIVLAFVVGKGGHHARWALILDNQNLILSQLNQTNEGSDAHCCFQIN